MTKRDDDTAATADRRDAAADRRDSVADARDVLADDRDQLSQEREIDIETIFAAADLRDAQADARDFAAEQRDMAANLDAFVRNVDDADAFDARESARRDRLRSKADRVASELDRYLLTDVGPSQQEREAKLDHRIAAAVDRLEADNARQQVTDSRAVDAVHRSHAATVRDKTA
jgi:hypothetical protein